MMRDSGFNVIGHITGNLGLGVLARNIVRLLQQKGHSLAVYDVDPGAGRARHDLSFERFAVATPKEMPYSINLFVLPPSTLQELIPTLAKLVTDASRINVAFPMWEHFVLPPLWREVLEFFDVLVAGSPFIRAVFELNLSGVFNVLGHPPIFLPVGVTPDRVRFRLPDDRVIFLSAFEPFSDLGRKNPRGALAAFSMATVRAEKALLVLKVNNRDAAVKDLGTADFLDEANRSTGVKVLSESLSYDEVLRLYASVDVVVSLHRSEGVGLVPQEAMTLGKPVIATAWSGNMGYMNHTNACLVDYELVPVKGSGGIYAQVLSGSKARWAEPNLRTAATWMERLASDDALRASYGREAATTMKAFHADALQAKFLDELVLICKNRAFLAKTPSEREKRLKRLRVGNWIDLWKRRVRARLPKGL